MNGRERPERRRREQGRMRPAAGAALGLAVLAALVWYGAHRSREPAVRVVTVYAFSALQGVLDEEVLPAFAASWQERTGERVEFVTSFAGSGLLVDRLVREVPADVVILASPLDALRLTRRGVLPVGAGGKLPHDGVPFRTPIVLGVRAGNPLGITGFDGLGRSDVEILHSDPLTSGAGEWSVLASFGAALAATADRDTAAARLEEMWRRVEPTFSTARQASRAFEEGRGNVLVTYESEAKRLSEGGTPMEIVYPPVTALCEPVVVKLPRNVPADEADVVDALIRFLWDPRAQRVFAEHGFRPVEGDVVGTDFPPIERALQLEDYGGAEKAEKDIVLDVWKKRIAPRAERATGADTP
jgi:sulfate/thiosulfate transport system substrate-binding protein